MTTEITDPRRGQTSASNAAADRGCEGRHIAQRGLPDKESDDASFGNAIHLALASGDSKTLSETQLAVYESCAEIRNRIMTEVFGAEKEKAEVFMERRWWCQVLAAAPESPKNTRYEHSGQVDFLARIGSKGLIIDYKCLPGEVAQAANNEQLRDLVVLASGSLGLTEVVTAIIQPMVTHDPDKCLYNTEAIKQATQEMFARVRKSNNYQAKRTANEVSCKFCLARFTCLEYQSWAAPLLPETASVAGVPVAQWTPEQRTHFCNMRGVAQRWLDDCADEMKRLLRENDQAVPGYHLKAGAVRESVNDPQELFNRFSVAADKFVTSEKGQDMDAQNALVLHLFMQCVSVKKGELESTVRKVTQLKGKALAAKLEELLSGIVDRKECEASLARIKGVA